MYRPVMPLRFDPKDMPPSGDCRVCEVFDSTGRMVSCITQYDDGRRTYEFDNDALYPVEVVREILRHSVLLLRSKR